MQCVLRVMAQIKKSQFLGSLLKLLRGQQLLKDLGIFIIYDNVTIF
jgi:hypothetical protein